MTKKEKHAKTYNLIMRSELYGDEKFSYDSAKERSEGLKRLKKKANKLNDGIMRCFFYKDGKEETFKYMSESQEPDHETYKVFCANTAHITKKDSKELSALVGKPCSMIFERETGFFIKLYDEETIEDMWMNKYEGLSKAFFNLIKYAYFHGYRMVELDCDAREYDFLKKHDW